MTAEQFRREFEKWSNLLQYARRVNDAGGQVKCEQKLTELAEAGARGMTETE
jgi:hypothetical protein